MTRLAITCGDPAGIGPEVIGAWLRGQDRVAARDLTLIGPAHWVRQNLPDTRAEGVTVGEEDFVAVPGQPTREGAAVALAALEVAAAGAEEGRWQAVVTGPVAKKWMQEAGFVHPGQTEFFAERWGGEPTMAFAGERLRVALATWHIPLREVPDALTPGVLERTVRHTWQLCRAAGVPRPRLGVCGLNPHAGEGGMLGTEEYDWIDGALDSLRPEFPGLSACQPGDTVFFRHLEGEFDAVVALYHDQGLGPLKTLEFHTAVNLTLGLRHVRTSPDHGTAFALAGRGLARADSLARAVDWALRLARS